tara:strand:+ start:143 stop:646 length:504 start_codon:yes stop_codon:yes gene_type:complete
MKDNFRPSAAQPNPPNETRVKETDDMVFLLEQHKKDIWEWKQKESQWIRDKNQLDGNKRIIEELSTKLVEIAKVNMALKKRAQEAEGETTIVKGIGMNSPEMRALQKRVTESEEELKRQAELNMGHQSYNGYLQQQLTEVREDNKRLSKQIENYIKNHEDKFRKAGL